MSTPDPRLSRRDAERLLDAPAERDDALGWALTAAGGPAHEGELRREDAMVAAFHAARVAPPPATRTGFVSPTRLASRAATRAVIATGAVVALTSGGFALANSAALQHLPLLPDRASDRASEAVSGAPRPTDPSTTASGSTPSSSSGSSGSSSGPSSASTGDGSPSSSDGSPSQAPGTSSTPSPHLEGLCKAFQAAEGSGRSLDSAVFEALTAAAGRADDVATYCVSLIGPPKETGRQTEDPTPTTQPTKPSKPSPTRPTPTKPTPTKPTPTKPTPTGSPTSKPTPTSTPTGAATPSSSPTDANPGSPTDHPTGKPDDPGRGGRNG